MVASSSHTFELRASWHAYGDAKPPAPPPRALGAWPDSSDSDVGDDQELTIGEEFVDHMASLLMHNTLSARQFCTAMWWTQKAGAEEAKAYAFRPDAPSGH